MSAYTPNEKQVISKVIDDEAVIIKLEQGVYYSLNEVGTVIWQQIMEKNTKTGIIDYIVSNYSIDKEIAAQDIETLLKTMQSEQLIITSNESSTPNVSVTKNNKVYTPPEIEAYRDMEDLLALDPPVPGMNDVTWKN